MKIENVAKRFGDKIIFDNFNCEISDGKITYIMGKSGSGKTTLSRMISGLDKDFSGKIFGNENKKISCVFQEPRLFPFLTVSENITMIENGTSLTVDEILNVLELSDVKNTYPSSLSGGMKMRVSISRALYYNGDIFIMDEPFSALDEDTKSRIIPKILELLKGKTVIIISHDIAQAQKYSDNIISL